MDMRAKFKVSVLRQIYILLYLKVNVSFSEGDWLYIYDGNQTSGSAKKWKFDLHNDGDNVYLFPTRERLLIEFKISETSAMTASITDNIPRTYHK